MAKISPIQVQKRFQKISPVLQEALFSPTTAEVVDKIVSKNHLTEEKALAFAELVGLVFLGFVHPEDLAYELRSQLGIDSKLAATLANDAQNRLFAPLAEEIAKTYVLPPEESFLVEEIKKPENLLEKQELEKKKVAEGIEKIELKESEAEVKIDETLSKIQKARESEPAFFKPTSPEEELEAPLVISTTESTPAPLVEEASALSPKSEIQSAPVVIHEESSAPPVATSPKFRLKISSLFSKLGIPTKPKIPPPPRPAEVELGSPPLPPTELAEENRTAKESESPQATPTTKLTESVDKIFSYQSPLFPSMVKETPSSSETQVLIPPAPPEPLLSPEEAPSLEPLPPQLETLQIEKQPKNEEQPKVVHYDLSEAEKISNEAILAHQKPNIILAPKATEEKTTDDIIIVAPQPASESEEKSKSNQTAISLFKKFLFPLSKITKIKKSLPPKPETEKEPLLPPSPPAPPLPPSPPPLSIN